MDLIKGFFERGIEIDIILIYYLIMVIFFLAFCFFYFMPEKKALKFFTVSLGYRSKMEYYNWKETLRRQKIFYIVGIIYSIFTLILTKVYGKRVAEGGIWILALILFLLAIWIGPVKKSKKK